MSPPFSPDEDDEDEGDRRTPARRRHLPSAPPAAPFRDLAAASASTSSPYEENVLADPAFLNRHKANKRAGRNGTAPTRSGNDADAAEGEEPEHDEYSKLKRTTPIEQQPKINKVVVEIPLVLTRPTTTTDSDSSGEGSSVIPRLHLSQDTRFSLHSHVPPSTPDGRWTGSVGGNAKVNQLVGSTNGSAQVSYKINSKTHLLAGLDLLSTAAANGINSQRPCQLQLGARYAESSTSSMHVTLQQQEKNSWGVNLLTRDVMDPWILSSSFWWNPRKGQWRSTLSVASMTTHRVRLSMGLKSPNAFITNTTRSDSSSRAAASGWFPSLLSVAQIHLDPKLSSNRRAPVALQYQPGSGVWNLTAALYTTNNRALSTPSQKKSSQQQAVASSWQLGLLGGSTKSSTWSVLLAWTYGDITLRVPILLSTTLAMTQKSSSSASTKENKLVALVTPLLVLAISGLAQEMVTRLVVNWNNSGGLTAGSLSSSNSNSTNAIPNAKAKQDAQSQQTLMKRQADNRRSTEQEKNGLVIEKATYQLDDTVSWDVTIPLQFWVSTDTSTLTLAEGSKQHLLGFYPLSKNAGSDDIPKGSSNIASTSDNTYHHSTSKGDNPGVAWWKEYWTPTAKRATFSADKKKTVLKETAEPTLKIQYTYGGKPFEVTVRDDEGLRLPQQESKSV